jgi:hypothetical protein
MSFAAHAQVGQIAAFISPTPGGGCTGICLISHTTIPGNANAGTTSSAINTTGANFLFINVHCSSSLSVPTPSDSLGNTWTAGGAYGSGAGVQDAFFFVANATVGSSQTFSLSSATGSVAAAEVVAFSGVLTSSPGDGTAGNGNGSGTSVQPGSITPTGNGRLVLTGMGYTSASTQSVNDSFIVTDTVAFTAAVNYGGSLAYLIQATAAAINPTWTFGTSQPQSATSVVAFKP